MVVDEVVVVGVPFSLLLMCVSLLVGYGSLVVISAMRSLYESQKPLLFVATWP